MGKTAASTTGLWTGVYFGATAKFCAGERGALEITDRDRAVLGPLTRQVRRLSERPREQEKRRQWCEHNDLKDAYPLVLCDPENGWNEIITEPMLECRGNLARRWEWALRRQIFWGERLLDDRPIEAVFEVGYTHTDSEWGIDVVYHGGEEGTAYSWEPAIRTPADIERIRTPQIEVDYGTTERTLELARSVFGDELEVKLKGLNPHSPHMTRDLAKMVGMENMMVMMYDDPDTLHAIMKKFVAGHLARYDFLEKHGLFTLNNDGSYVGSGGVGYTRELPRRTLGPGEPVRTRDLWMHTESQESVGVSPEMFQEFIFPYQAALHARYGLNCYGCCEPLESRWPIVRNIPNLRRVSVSAWADEDKMAQGLADRCIYSRKPNPADLAPARLNEDSARSSIRRTLEVTAGGCIVELVMKDNHTIGRNPENVIRWVEIAREEITRARGEP